MKILFVPYARHPYYKLLTDALRKQGVETESGKLLKFFTLTKQVRQQKNIDIVHITWSHAFFITGSRVKTFVKALFFIVDLIAIKIIGIKLIWTVHNKYDHEQRHRDIDILVRRMLTRICDAMIIECKKAKMEIVKILNLKDSSKIKIIPAGNYIDAYPNAVDRKDARDKLGFKSENFIFLSFGLIRPYKGITELIDVFNDIDHPQSKLLIAGKPFHEKIAEEIRDKCCANNNIMLIFEDIPENEVQIYMNAADIVVLPYRDILTSGVVILAMSFSKAVIAPAMGCISDILDEKGSFLYEPSNKDGLTNSMKLALGTDLEDLRNMGNYNFELAKKFDWEDIGRKIFEVYKDCLK